MEAARQAKRARGIGRGRTLNFTTASSQQTIPNRNKTPFKTPLTR